MPDVLHLQPTEQTVNESSMRALLQSERRGVYRTLLDQLIGVGCSQASHLTLFSRVAVVREPHRGQQAMLPTSPRMSSLGQPDSAAGLESLTMEDLYFMMETLLRLVSAQLK